MRNLESSRTLLAFLHASGTLRLNRIDREQYQSQERKGGPRGPGAGKRAEPSLAAEVGWKLVVGCGAV